MFDKQTILDYLWSYSHFYSYCLSQSEELYRSKNGFSAITVLFSCLENISKSAINDYESNLFNVFKKLFDTGLITRAEYDFLNTGESCIRKIRNLYAHANITAINLVENQNDKEILYPLSEDKTSLLLYARISDIVYNLIIKLASCSFIEDLKQKFCISLDEPITKCHIKIKKLSVEELLILKGYPPNYISDELDIPEDAQYRIIDNIPDANVYTFILSEIKSDFPLILKSETDTAITLKEIEEEIT